MEERHTSMGTIPIIKNTSNMGSNATPSSIPTSIPTSISTSPSKSLSSGHSGAHYMIRRNPHWLGVRIVNLKWALQEYFMGKGAKALCLDGAVGALHACEWDFMETVN